MTFPPDFQIVIIGGGAAGFFAAITAAENFPAAKIIILERGADVLQKVRVSGGGRCNVTHHCLDARELVKNYPRGSREMLSPFLKFGAQQTIEWFASRGVLLKTEADGRMFPTTDDSATIVNCLVSNVLKNKIEIRTGARVEKLEKNKAGKWANFLTKNPAPLLADRVLVASGSNPAMWEILKNLGHRIVEPVPSLFTFNTKDVRLRDLAGVSVPKVSVKILGEKLVSEGPILVTHWGLSGPAILKLSAWGARDFHRLDYRFSLIVNWLDKISSDEVLEIFLEIKNLNGKKQVSTGTPRHDIFKNIPNRLWQNLVAAASISETQRWADLDKNGLRKLAEQLTQSNFQITGKSTFKEEFVTAGGVDLRDVNFKTFESKICPGLFFAGEVLDIDAVTGGFNFQAAWTGGWIVGKTMNYEL